MQAPFSVDWKDANEARHLAKHGVPFGFAGRIFLDSDRLEAQDVRRTYPEPRFNTVGVVDGVTLHVTFTMEFDIAIIISARRASRKERRRYAENHP